MKLVKIASGVSASVALLGAGGAASMPQVQVQAAVKYQIRVSKKAYVYTSKGKKTKKSYKKNAKVTAYGIKWIKGKKYYNLGRGRYIRTSNAKKVVHRYSYSTQTKKITRTIKMYQPKGVKKVIQNAYIKRTVKTDNKTKKKTYGVWSTSSWKKYKVAKVSGYTASRSSVGAAKVTYKRKNQTIKITYKVIKKTNKKKKTSKKTDTKHATKPSTTPSKPANSGSSGSTGNSGSSSSSSSSSNNPGKGDAGASNKPSNSGSSSPDSNKPSEKPSEPVKTAPADKVTTKEVPFKTVYQADSSMEAGTKKTVKNGENGIDTTTTKYNVDGSVKSTSTARTKEAVNEVIAVGTKTLVKTENLPYKTVNKDDSTLAKGTTKVVTKGVNGSRTTTTTYSLNTQTGKVTPTSSVKTVDPIDEVIAVGTKKAESSKPSEPVKTAPADKVTTKEVPFKTVYQADSSMEAGTKKTVKNGENGIDTTTTKYNIDGSIKSTSTVRTKEAVDEVVAVGTKTSVKTESLPYKTVNKDDNTLAKGTTKVVTKGVNGSKTTTTTYSLNTQTGEVTPTSSVKTVDPVDEVIAVGTAVAPAPKVSNETVAYKTVYRADSSMDAGTKKTIRAGVNGEDVTITIYNIDGSIKSTSTTHSKKAVDQIVAVGTKQTVKVETISYKTVKKDDSTLAKGTTKVITAGENGSRTTTTTYDLDTETGEVTANEQVTTVDPVDEVIAVGTREANPFNAEKTAELKQRLLAMINDYRAEVGASPLTMLDTYDSILDERAASKAKDLGTTGTWDHSGYDDLPEALTTVSDEELKAHGADDGYVHGGESIGANCFGLYDSTEDQINNYMHYEKMAEDDEKADYQAIVIDKTRDYFTGPSQTCLHYLMMIDKKISKVYMGVGTYVDANGNAWLSAIFEFAL